MFYLKQYNNTLLKFDIVTDNLDGSYAAFGKVIDGMGVVDSIASVRTNMFNDAPVTPVVIKSITVDTKGEEFKEPNKLAER